MNETPKDGVIRELYEEFEIEVSNIRLLDKYVENIDEYQNIYHTFCANLETPIASVRCNEGVCVRFFTPEQVFKLPQHSLAHLVMNKYLALVSEDESNYSSRYSQPE